MLTWIPQVAWWSISSVSWSIVWGVRHVRRDRLLLADASADQRVWILLADRGGPGRRLVRSRAGLVAECPCEEHNAESPPLPARVLTRRQKLSVACSRLRDKEAKR